MCPWFTFDVLIWFLWKLCDYVQSIVFEKKRKEKKSLAFNTSKHSKFINSKERESERKGDREKERKREIYVQDRTNKMWVLEKGKKQISKIYKIVSSWEKY